jgi:hypothetical protein
MARPYRRSPLRLAFWLLLGGRQVLEVTINLQVLPGLRVDDLIYYCIALTLHIAQSLSYAWWGVLQQASETSVLSTGYDTI